MANELVIKNGMIVMGGVYYPYKGITQSYIPTDNDYFIDCLSGSFSVVLPTAVSPTPNYNRSYVLKNSGSGVISIIGTASQTIDNSFTYSLYQYDSVGLLSNGSNWITQRSSQGVQGLTGPQGVQGVQGFQGFQGLTGPQGFQGFQGLTGPQGFQGFQGLTGPQGFQGFQGLTGPQGFQGFQGLTGPQGFQGFQGLTGPQGFQGATGPGFTAINTPGTNRVLTANGSSTTTANANSNLTFDNSTSALLVVPSTAGGGKTVLGTIQGALMDIHPESAYPVMFPFYTNDLAYNRLRGGTNSDSITSSNTFLDTMFNGQSDYATFDATALVASGGTYTVTSVFYSQSLMRYGQYYGVHFGNAGWRAKTIQLDLQFQGVTAWTNIISVTGWSQNALVVSTSGLAATASTAMRWTFNDYQSPASNSGFRIAQLWGSYYNSIGQKETLFGRDGGNIYADTYLKYTPSTSTVATSVLLARNTITGRIESLSSNLYYLQGGNSFGTTASLGTTDNYNLQVIANNTLSFTVFTNSNVTFASSITTAGNINGGLNVQAGSTNAHYWYTRSQMKSPVDGTITLYNNALTDFGLLQFGGTSSSFPALKRSTTNLQARLADDSGYTGLDSSFYLLSGNTALNSSGSSLQLAASGAYTNLNILKKTLINLNPVSNTSGALSIGSASFDGITTGFFTGSNAGTSIAVNEASGYIGNFIDLQIAGVRVFYIDYTGRVQASGSFLSSGNLQAGSGQIIYFTNRTKLTSPSDGNLLIQNFAQTDFNLLQFGGTSSSFPALKRTGSILSVKLADDSAYTGLSASTLYSNSLQTTTLNIQGLTFGGILYVDNTGLVGATALSLTSSYFAQSGNSFGATAMFGTNDAYNLVIETNNTPALIILTNSTVGIGTLSPNTTMKLDVNGQANFNGTVYGNAFSLGGNNIFNSTGLAVSGSGNSYILTSILGGVGIGTASPTYRLHIIGTATNGPLNVNNNLVVDVNGNIGIGTASPGRLLEVNGISRYRDYAEYYYQNTLSGRIGNAFNLTTPGGANDLTIFASNNIYFKGSTGNGNSLPHMMLNNLGNLSIGTVSTTGLTQRVLIVGSGSTSATTTLLVTNNSNYPSLSILDNGFIGIGTVSAAYQLQVLGTASISGQFYLPLIQTSSSTYSVTVDPTTGRLSYNAALTNIISNPAPFRLLIATNSVNNAIAVNNLTFNPSTSQLGLSGSMYISSTVSGTTLININGSSGQLFSVVDGLTGSLFTVNAISGLPLFTVNSDYSVYVKSLLTTNTLQIYGLTGSTRYLFIDTNGNVGATALNTSFFAQGGNSFGATAMFGTNDAYNLVIESNNTPSIFVFTTSNVSIGGATDSGNKFYVNGTSSFNGNIIPAGNSLYNSGSSTAIWNAVYSSQYYLGTNQAIYITSNHLNFKSIAATDILVNPGGTTTARFYSTGNTLFQNGATSTDNGYRVQIVGTATNGPLNVNNYLVVGATGNIGIGTTGPSYKLDVAGSARATTAVVGNTSNSGLILDVIGTNGRLISVTDGLTSSIFQVNNISGVSILSVNPNGGIYLNSVSNSVLGIGTQSLMTFSASSFYATFVDYYVYNTLNYSRSGTLNAVWNYTSGALNYYETSTSDIGGDTSGIAMGVTLSGANLTIQSYINSGTWSIKMGVRIL